MFMLIIHNEQKKFLRVRFSRHFKKGPAIEKEIRPGRFLSVEGCWILMGEEANARRLVQKMMKTLLLLQCYTTHNFKARSNINEQSNQFPFIPFLISHQGYLFLVIFCLIQLASKPK